MTGRAWQYRVTVQTADGYEEADRAVSGPLYHGGRPGRRVGDLLTAGRRTNTWGDTRDDRGRSVYVYFTTRREVAASYAEAMTRGAVYEVEPVGEFRPDYCGDDFRSEHPLRVVRVVPRGEWSA